MPPRSDDTAEIPKVAIYGKAIFKPS